MLSTEMMYKPLKSYLYKPLKKNGFQTTETSVMLKTEMIYKQFKSQLCQIWKWFNVLQTIETGFPWLW